jgi:hypothetical protein
LAILKGFEVPKRYVGHVVWLSLRGSLQ